MKKAVMFLAGLCFTLTVAAQEKKEAVQGNGDTTKEKRKIGPDYSKIKVTGNFEVSLISGDTGTLSMEGEENLLPLVTTEVKNGTLFIGSENDKFLTPSRNRKITIKVPVNALSEVFLKGSGSINVKNRVKNDIKLLLDGCGSINVSVNTDNVEACVLGSGEIKIDGQAQSFECKVVGSGIIKAYDLKAPNVNAVVSGAGDVEANSSKKLKGRISGSGNIAFAGEPSETDLKHSGTGKFTFHQ
ncbi:DUF2807 domain-containing protein [Flavobacterium album]|uniref:DUF2807 domain-containing protein n=1 Tax=Flavobacterium album TaxID=2175091 RepID=A0A2S1QYY3_9FLAO|nr:head GIN domain-containing protein [Flavobacterium album]AWH85451.1 DUF2807 domain-containing protein [Flavobacterium album]